MESAAGRVMAGYALLAALAGALALAFRDGMPWDHPRPWLSLDVGVAHATSAAGGVVLALVAIAMTRLSVARFPWARGLHLELRPVARGLSLGHIAWIAGLSSLGEELLFRGLLVPWLGILPSAVLFGAAHQVPGPSRWVWMCWAALMGLGLGAIFAATGSLLGPLVAHAIINAVNLAYLRDHDPLARIDESHTDA